MPTKMTPKLPRSPLGRRGKEAPYLCDDYEVKHQNEPTPSTPISEHKQFAGYMMPEKLESFK